MNTRILTEKSRWEGRNSRQEVTSVPFQDLFHKYLEPAHGKTCLEIGCVPGTFLAYICKHFGYRAVGVDYVNDARRIVSETLVNNGIEDCEIHEDDLLCWHPGVQYDLVCSFGFIEHFAGESNDAVIERHIALLNSGGTLILEVPNFRNGQYVIHRTLNPEKLKQHNLATMKKRYYREIAKKYDLKVEYLGHSGGFFDFWTSNRSPSRSQRLLISILNRIKSISGNTSLKRLNNPFCSPALVFIARKN